MADMPPGPDRENAWNEANALGAEQARLTDAVRGHTGRVEQNNVEIGGITREMAAC